MGKEKQQKVDLRNLVTRLHRQSQELQQREIIAPLLPHGKIRVRIAQIVYEFSYRGNFVGWGRFRPLNEREMELLAEAQPWERGGFLELLPALRVVMLWPDTRPQQMGVWWALAFNESDARQRFGLNAEPVPVYLCDPANGAARFERAIVRVDGRTLWFEGPDAHADPTHAEWLRETADHPDEMQAFLPGLARSERQALLYAQMHQLEAQSAPQRGPQQSKQQIPGRNRQQQQAWLHSARQRNDLEQRLRYALEKADAVLHSYSEQIRGDNEPGEIVVEWSMQGQRYRYRSTVKADLSVVASGICLSERDHEFDLTSLVKVMNDAPSWSMD